MKKLFELIRKRRDKMFLRRLERVMNNNVIDASIRLTGCSEVGVYIGQSLKK